MNRHDHEVPEGWRQVKLRPEPLGLWTIVHQVTGTGYGPMALLALGLPAQPTAGLARPEALRLGAEIEQAMSGTLPETAKSARKCKK